MSEQYTVNLYFELHEEALSELFKTQVFPHPVGYHGNDQYDIYLWNSSVDIEPGVVDFNFTITADAMINGVQLQYDYPLTIPLNFPQVDVSITGIISLIEGIPALINTMDGHQWIKDIIITEYEALELIVYPNELLEAANEDIPDALDITIGNFGFNWMADLDVLRFTFYTQVVSNRIFVITEAVTGEGEYTNMGIRMIPNVHLTLFGYNIQTLLGRYHTFDYALDMTLTPDAINEINIDFGEGIETSNYWELELFFGSNYGLWIYSYSFSGPSNWTTISPTIIPNN